MAGLNLRGDTSGSVEIVSPAVAGDNTITLPKNNGGANQFFKNSTTAGIVTHSSMVELANGQVAIGTDIEGYADYADNLTIADTSDCGLTIRSGTSSQGNIYFSDNTSGTSDEYEGIIQYLHADNAMAFGVNNGVERLRINSSGRIKIGSTEDPSNKNNVTPMVLIDKSGVDGSLQVNRHTSVGGGGAQLILSATRGSSAGSHTVLQEDDGIGTIDFLGSDGDEFVPAATIQAQLDRTAGGNDMPGRLIFKTTANGASGATERMRISQDGRIGIGVTYANNTRLYVYTDENSDQQGFFSYLNSYGAYAGLFRAQGGDSTQYAIYGYVETTSTYSSGGLLAYSINTNTYAILGYWSTAAYYSLYGNGLVYASGGFSSSDERLKDVSRRIEGGVLDNITSIVPVEYTWKENTQQRRSVGVGTQIGLIAQEVEVNFPHLVMENYHTVVAGENPTTLNEEIGNVKSVEYGKLTCYLLVALKEANDKIKALEAHVGIAST